MSGRMAIVLLVAAMVALIVAVDIMFFRHQMLERLVANVGIVLVFAAIYWIFLRRA